MKKKRIDSHRADDGGDRRSERRYPALDNTAHARWSHAGQDCTTAAQLMDVSRDGLLVLVDDEPPAGASVQIRLEEPIRTAWVEAVVTEVRRMKQGPCQLRLAFATAPPAGFLALAAARDGERN